MFQIAKHSLGKYIIIFACLLHVGWAILLMLDIRAGNATPISVLFALVNSRPVVITTLIFVAFCAWLFLDLRVRRYITLRWLTIFLIPQQIVLTLSAGAGIYAIIIQRYPDEITGSWAHIAVEQLPMILMAILYTIATLETLNPPRVSNATV